MNIATDQQRARDAVRPVDAEDQREAGDRRAADASRPGNISVFTEIGAGQQVLRHEIRHHRLAGRRPERARHA